MRKLAVAAVLGLLLAPLPLLAEPAYFAASVSQTVGSHTFERGTQEVTILSDGPATCYYRLFTDADTTGNATTSNVPIKLNEVHPWRFTPGVGTEAYVGTTRARHYSSVSYICATGQTAAWRIVSK
jgi:hypothetical protein